MVGKKFEIRFEDLSKSSIQVQTGKQLNEIRTEINLKKIQKTY